ncbi:MAG: Ni/Fe-hydrogenase, b-type cytochrome subunit [Veillonellales bacterium]
MDDNVMKPFYVFSPFLRVFHWIMVVSILILFGTGLYIGNPGYIGSLGIEPTFAVDNIFSMENIRYIHFATAFIFMSTFIFRWYGAFVNKGDRLFPKPWTFDYWLGTLDVALHYMFITPEHRPYLRNHMARAGYASVYVLIFIEAVTGLAMYYMIEPNSILAIVFGQFNYWLINEYVVHLLHHYVAWGIILFAITHIYMAVRADLTENGGEISSMFSGIKYLHVDPDDIGDID